MMNTTPIQRDLVLVGGGHATIQVLRSFGMNPIEGVRVTLITDVLKAPYSGMLPGFVEGIWSEDTLMFDLAALSAFAGARLIYSAITHIDVEEKIVILQSAAPVSYDIISVNTGAVPDTSNIAGAQEHALRVKPIAGFLHNLPKIDKITDDLAIIGAGAAGSELALALRARMTASAQRPNIHLIGRAANVLPRHPSAVSRIMKQALDKANITSHLGSAVRAIDKQAVTLENGAVIPAEICLMVTAARPAVWVSGLPVARDERGFLAVTSRLHLPDRPDFFAAGDIASVIGYEREKAGVFAVRAGPVLVHNLRAALTGKSFISWRPQKRYLALIGLANGHALAVRGSLVSSGAMWLRLKHWIDKRFMDKFTDLPLMQVAPPRTLPALQNSDTTASHADNNRLPEIYCAGCGSKAEAGLLSAALKDACQTALLLGANPAYFPPEDIFSDAADMPPARKKGSLIQSVDYLSQAVSDPFLFGRIAALHAMSDILVAGAQPLSALGLVMTERAIPDVQQRDLSQMLAGALVELSAHHCQLSGGHTVSATQAGLGFSITGERISSSRLPTTNDEVTLILTKPLGIGIILAAQMRGRAPAEALEGAYLAMATSNAPVTAVIGACRVAAMTDVTGFGLARHALNLAARCGFSGVHLTLDDIPLLAGAAELSASGIASSLRDGNMRAVPEQHIAPDLAPEKTAILFDPQTSGGVLAAIPSTDAEPVIAALARLEGSLAVRIGRFTSVSGLTLS